MERHPASPPVNPSVRYEPRDASVGTMLLWLMGLAMAIALALGFLWPFYYVLSSAVERRVQATAPNALKLPLPPEPRLQGAPGHEEAPEDELQKMRSDAEATLDSYGWVDQKQGIARIPITEAMRLFAEKQRTAIAHELPNSQAATAPVSGALPQLPAQEQTR